MTSYLSVRFWLVGWLYLVALGHFFVAVGITWFADFPGFTGYHQRILSVFGFSDAAAMEMHLWWMALFGATLQAFALFMLALIYVANRYSHSTIWFVLACVILLWVPQDIFISIKKNVWMHVWIDLAAVIALVPPLIILWRIDRKPVLE